MATFHPVSIKAIFFDFMGTCLDWHTTVSQHFPTHIPPSTAHKLSLAWREAFFAEIHRRFELGLPSEDIDTTHARLLKQLLDSEEWRDCHLSEDEQQIAVQSWHRMRAWPEVSDVLDRLRSRYEIFVLANGTTRLQLDLQRSSGLRFDMLFSSELLGLTKPDSRIYLRAMELVGVKAEECLMVAAHAYDLRAAKKVGMRTIYVQRWSEDGTEDMEQVRQENDDFIGLKSSSGENGFSRLAQTFDV